MQITAANTDSAVITELGHRAARIRLDKNLTQTALAAEAGVHRNTLDRFEAGESVSLTNFVRIMRVLDLLPGFEQLLPEPQPSPIEQLKLSGKVRRRARPAPAKAPDDSAPDDSASGEWNWGDEEPRR